MRTRPDSGSLTTIDPSASSTRASQGQHANLREECLHILEHYRPSNPHDDTAQVLGAFLEHLTREGQLVLMKEITSFDPDQLRQLRTFLVQAILRPSTFSTKNAELRNRLC